MTELVEIQSEFRTSIEVEKYHVVHCIDILSDVADGKDVSYRADEAQALVRTMGRYLAQLIDINEQDTP